MEKITQNYFLVLGAGVSGQAAIKLLNRLGERALLVDGMGPQDISEFSTLILSPGIPKTHPLVLNFLVEGKEVIGEIEFSSRYIKTPIVAVTGSNGKTTVCMMMSEFLEKLGKKVFLGGNIGVPLAEAAIMEFDGTAFDFIVCELSSFQLESISSFSPRVAGILNLTFTHGERYGEFRDYIKAKSHITDYQKSDDKLFVCESYDLEELTTHSKAQKYLWNQSHEYGFTFMKVIGDHNKRNFRHCFQMVNALGVEFSHEQAQAFIQEFEGAEYRIQRVHHIGPFIFYNDAKSTNLKSTLTALECFQDKKVLLICGGKKRDDKLSEFHQIKDYKQMIGLYLTGESSKDLQGITGGQVFETLGDVMLSIEDFMKSYEGIEPIHILFSPAFPSFDYYQNYKERAEHFNKLVLQLSL